MAAEDTLLAALRRARRIKVEVDGRTYLARRLTDEEALRYRQAPCDMPEFARRYVDGWERVLESDVIPGGGSDAAPWSAGVWSEYVADRPELWQPIADAVLEAYRLHREQREAVAKN